MQIIDWIAIGIVVGSLLIGGLIGFGKLLKIFTGGIVGIIISIVVTYFCIGVVGSWGFVQELMAKLLTAMQNADNFFVNFLLKIGIEKILLAIILFGIIQLARVLIVSIIKNVMEVENPVMKFFNRLLGMIFMTAISCMVALLVFHIIDLIGGGTEENFINYISGSVFKLDWVFTHNPLKYVIERVIPNN
ncbi:MAG: hypothetical protein K2N14_05310 [Clostridia bacterium]|nr:hypothetical protein [Clostridia bacterium]